MKQSMSVTSWLESYDNPMNEVVRRIRDVILHADARIRESLDGNAPTFSYRGTLASIFPESKKHASLMIPQGAEIPGHHPRLEGSGDTRRVIKIASVSEANAAKDDLQHLVRAWCDWREAEGAAEEASPAAEKATEPAAQKARPAAKKARKPAAKKASAPAAKKARKPAAKKAGGAAAKKGGKPAVKKAQKPTARKAAKPATTKGRGGRRGA